MPTTRPGFIWSGTEWVAIGQEAVVNPFYYQATAPTGAATGAIWVESDVDVPSIDSAQFLRWRKTMVGGETSLSGNDDSSLPLAYTPGYEQLYINGVLQVRGSDYTATTGTTVTGLTALVANDVVEIFSAVARTVADVYTQTQSDARFVNKNVGGLNLVVPTGATGATVGTNGVVTIGSAVNTVTVNGAFNSTYDNYKIIATGGVGSQTASLHMQLGSTTTNYKHAIGYIAYTTGNPTSYSSSNGTTKFLDIGGFSTSSLNLNIELHSPFASRQTMMVTQYAQTDVGSVWGAGAQQSTTSFTDFTLTTGAGTLTGGTIRIYGYNNGA